jgi:hypothetical protein
MPRIRTFYLHINGKQEYSQLHLNVWRIAVIYRALKHYQQFVQQRDHVDMPSREQGCIAWLLPRIEDVLETMGWTTSTPIAPAIAPAEVAPHKNLRPVTTRDRTGIDLCMERREKSATPIVDDDRN